MLCDALVQGQRFNFLFLLYLQYMNVCLSFFSRTVSVTFFHLCNTFCYILYNYFCLQNVRYFVEVCLQLAMENCQWPHRNTNMTVIELTSHHNMEILTPHLKTLLPYYLQVGESTLVFNLYGVYCKGMRS